MQSVPPPGVNMRLVAKTSKKHREAINGYVPTGLSVIDYARTAEIDAFYILCQDNRDYYRDPYYKIARPNYFSILSNECGKKPNRSVSSFQRPVPYVREKLPVTFPLCTHNVPYRPKWIAEPILYAGKINREPCMRFKR